MRQAKKEENKKFLNDTNESKTPSNTAAAERFTVIKIVEKSLILDIFHFCNCQKDFSLSNAIKPYTPSNSTGFEYIEQISSRSKKSISNLWSNFKIEFSYKHFNENSKSFEFVKGEKLNFLKICENESLFYAIIPAVCLISLAYLITFYSTNNKVTIPILKEVTKEVDEIKWWHGLFFLVFASLCLIIIFYFIKYISFIYTLVIGFYSYSCSFYTLNYIFKSNFIKKEEELSQGQESQDNEDSASKNISNYNFNNSNNINNNKAANKLGRSSYNAENIDNEENFDNSDLIRNENKSHKFFEDNEHESYNEKHDSKENSKCEFCNDENYKSINNSNYNKNSNANFDIELQENPKEDVLVETKYKNSDNYNFNHNYNTTSNQSTSANTRHCNCSKKSGKENAEIYHHSNAGAATAASASYKMSPIYNYRNSKILVFLNKKILDFQTTKNESSAIYYVVKLRFYELINLFIVGIIIYLWAEGRSWILNNLLAFSLCFIMLSIFNIRNFKICIILLSCIFFYDIFWVFFSKEIFKKNVMVEVATALNIPIKLEFPRFFSTNPLNNCMILGLGDIILPGIIIKYCKNFDLLKKYNNISENTIRYYKLSLRLYLISVILAFLMNFLFRHAQPVLFYIAPIFIVGLITNAIIQNECKDFLNGENYKITQMCVDEIINTEFSKFEERENHINRYYEPSKNVAASTKTGLNKDNKTLLGNLKNKSSENKSSVINDPLKKPKINNNNNNNNNTKDLLSQDNNNVKHNQATLQASKKSNNKNFIVLDDEI